MPSRGSNIERLLASEDWAGARRAIQGELRHAPDHHWLILRLALTYYEERKYEKALELETRASALPSRSLGVRGVEGDARANGRRSARVRASDSARRNSTRKRTLRGRNPVGARSGG